MNTHMVTYTVKADRLAENQALIRDIFDELDRVQPPGLTYQAFELPDGVSFIHLITYDKSRYGALPPMTSFKAFHADLHGRCAGAPARTELGRLGAHRPEA